MSNNTKEMFDWKIGDKYIHYTHRGDIKVGIVKDLVQIREFDSKLGCKFINLFLVNSDGRKIPADGTQGLIYKLDDCDAVE